MSLEARLSVKHQQTSHAICPAQTAKSAELQIFMICWLVLPKNFDHTQTEAGTIIMIIRHLSADWTSHNQTAIKSLKWKSLQNTNLLQFLQSCLEISRRCLVLTLWQGCQSHKDYFNISVILWMDGWYTSNQESRSSWGQPWQYCWKIPPRSCLSVLSVLSCVWLKQAPILTP